MKTTYTTQRHTTVTRKTAAAPPAVLRAAVLEILFEEQADGPADNVLVDGIIPLALAKQFQALIELHNRA